MDIMLFILDTGQQLLLLSMAISGVPFLPNQLAPDEEEAHLTEVNCIVEQL